jgi:hypothetical protein
LGSAVQAAWSDGWLAAERFLDAAAATATALFVHPGARLDTCGAVPYIANRLYNYVVIE